MLFGPHNPSKFHPDKIENLAGKTALVTGGNSGIGYHTVAQLARHGAKVYLGARNPQKAQDAIEKITGEMGDMKGSITFLKVDLADLSSCKQAAEEFKSKEAKLDILGTFPLQSNPQ